MVLSLSFAFAFAALVVMAWSYLSPSKKKQPPSGTTYPPGPPGKPLVGSMLDIPPQHSWFKFKELTDRYGAVTRVTIAGQTHILLGTEKIANDLLRERGTIYSDRVQLPAATLSTGGRSPLLLQYGEFWRNMRRFLHHCASSVTAPTYHKEQELEGTRMLRDILRVPGDYEDWFERFSGGVALRLIFGHRLANAHDYECRGGLAAVHDFERVASPGAYLVDLFPSLMYIPDALAPWKRELKALHQRDDRFFADMVGRVQRNMKSGLDVPSWARIWLENKQRWGLADEYGISVLGGALEAAVGTTAAGMMSFMLVVVRNPGWMEKLQEEVDRVVGQDRLPTLDDMSQLPLVRACVKETLRYYPVTAGGVPHKLTRDDTYEGYFFEEGTVVHPNQWAIHRDPLLYPDPESFNPERWLDPKFPTYREPLTKFPNLHNFSAFGNGRRICPGQNIAERSLNLQVALLAWGCHITKAEDAAGNKITPPFYDFVEGFNVQPKKFKFSLKPRNIDKVVLLEKLYQESLQDDPLYKEVSAE